MKIRFLGVLVAIGVLISVPIFAVRAAQEPVKADTCSIDSECLAKQITDGLQGLKNITATDFAYIPPSVPKTGSPQRAVSYRVETRGAITADVAQFKALANETLNNPLGWARLGVTFSEVANGGDFALVLSEAAQVPSFNPNVCGSDYSCQVGSYVIINQDRWLGATDPWNAGGGSLRDYRNMVVNHETGHWLGHPHEYCSGAGNKAPVMQQQSISLQGCSFNPWPLQSEMWSTRLGL
jgi:hypothetical protein